MATATITAGTLTQARLCHDGLFAQTFHYQYNGVSLSVSNMVILGWVQPGVTVIDAVLWGTDGNAGTSTFKIGTIAADTAIASATTIAAAVTRPTTFVPVVLTISADAEGTLRVPITMTKSVGTSTVTGSINLMLILQAPPA